MYWHKSEHERNSRWFSTWLKTEAAEDAEGQLEAGSVEELVALLHPESSKWHGPYTWVRTSDYDVKVYSYPHYSPLTLKGSSIDEYVEGIPENFLQAVKLNGPALIKSEACNRIPLKGNVGVYELEYVVSRNSWDDMYLFEYNPIRAMHLAAKRARPEDPHHVIKPRIDYVRILNRGIEGASAALRLAPTSKPYADYLSITCDWDVYGERSSRLEDPNIGISRVLSTVKLIKRLGLKRVNFRKRDTWYGDVVNDLLKHREVIKQTTIKVMNKRAAELGLKVEPGRYRLRQWTQFLALLEKGVI